MPKAAVAALVIGLLGAMPAQAQSKLDVFGGYSYTRSVGESFHGWNAAVTWNLGRRLGLTVDLAGHAASVEETDFSLFSYMAGPRYRLTTGRTRAFVQALAGRTRQKGAIHIFDVEIADSETYTSALGGGGLDYQLSERLSLRLAGAYVAVDGDDGWEGEPRVSVGLLYRFGSGS